MTSIFGVRDGRSALDSHISNASPNDDVYVVILLVLDFGQRRKNRPFSAPPVHSGRRGWIEWAI